MSLEARHVPHQPNAKDTGVLRSGQARDQRARSWLIRLVQILLIGVGLAGWFITQSLLAKRVPPTHIRDALFVVTASANSFLLRHPAWANALLITSSAGIDALFIFIALLTVFGSTLRPFLGLLILIALRQVCEGLISLPVPEGMIWHYPGFPSLLVTYATSTDFFFSGHTVIAVFAATELARLRRAWLTVLGVAIAVFEATTVVLLRAHYTMDIFGAIIAALWVAKIADPLAKPLDRGLARLVRS